MEDIERLITEYYCDMEKKCSLSESKMDDFFKQTTYQRHTKVWAKIKRMQFGIVWTLKTRFKEIFISCKQDICFGVNRSTKNWTIIYITNFFFKAVFFNRCWNDFKC